MVKDAYAKSGLKPVNRMWWGWIDVNKNRTANGNLCGCALTALAYGRTERDTDNISIDMENLCEVLNSLTVRAVTTFDAMSRDQMCTLQLGEVYSADYLAGFLAGFDEGVSPWRKEVSDPVEYPTGYQDGIKVRKEIFGDE